MHYFNTLDAEREKKEYDDHEAMPAQVSAVFRPYFADGGKIKKSLSDMVGKRFIFTKHSERLFWVCEDRQDLSKIKIEWMHDIEPTKPKTKRKP
jgi:hypothetical protein